MRVWLIEDEHCRGMAASFEPTMRSLAEQPYGDFTLVGVCGFRPDLLAGLRAGLLHGIVINTSVWNQDQSRSEILTLGLPLLLVGDLKIMESWSGLAAQHAVAFATLTATPGDVYAALWSLRAAGRREQEFRSQCERLQQRLNDRIIIEKAKGILMQRLAVPEEEAYQRLRMQSRRQRKQIREIAQSMLDTEMLLEDPGPGKTLHNGLPAGDDFRPETPLEEVAAARNADDKPRGSSR